jgi:hypothetical protein
MLNFVTLRSDYPELKMWGAQAGKVTFVVTKDEEESEFNACAKTVGVEGGKSIGEFPTFESAKLACEHYLRGLTDGRV